MTATRDDATTMPDDPWLAEAPKRSRLRLVLVALLGATLVFYAGVEVQKRYGVADPATAAGPLTGSFVPPGEQPDDATRSTSVIGKVVSRKGDKLVVEDFGGKRHTITLGSDVRVVLETAGDASDLKPGTTVQVTDSTITVR